MLSLNKAYFIGRVQRVPEVNDYGNVSLCLAVPHRRQQEDGTWLDTPDSHTLTAEGETTKAAALAPHKGDGVAIECEVRSSLSGIPSLVISRFLWVSPKAASGEGAPVPAPE